MFITDFCSNYSLNDAKNTSYFIVSTERYSRSDVYLYNGSRLS